MIQSTIQFDKPYRYKEFGVIQTAATNQIGAYLEVETLQDRPGTMTLTPASHPDYPYFYRMAGQNVVYGGCLRLYEKFSNSKVIHMKEYEKIIGTELDPDPTIHANCTKTIDWEKNHILTDYDFDRTLRETEQGMHQEYINGSWYTCHRKWEINMPIRMEFAKEHTGLLCIRPLVHPYSYSYDASYIKEGEQIEVTQGVYMTGDGDFEFSSANGTGVCQRRKPITVKSVATVTANKGALLIKITPDTLEQ